MGTIDLISWCGDVLEPGGISFAESLFLLHLQVQCVQWAHVLQCDLDRLSTAVFQARSDSDTDPQACAERWVPGPC